MLSSTAPQAAEVEQKGELWVHQYPEILQHQNSESTGPKEHLVLLSTQAPPITSRCFRLGPSTKLKAEILPKQDYAVVMLPLVISRSRKSA